MNEKRESKVKHSIHSQISKLLFPYVNGDISGEEDRMLFAHLPECVACQKKLGLAMLIATQGINWNSRDDPAETAPPGAAVPFRK
jgi:hypothetical protein